MKVLKHFLILSIAILGFSIVDAQAQSFSTDGKTVQTIERRVFKELIKLPYYGVFDNLKYKVDGDTVTLYGKVVRPLTKKQTEYKWTRTKIIRLRFIFEFISESPRNPLLIF